MDLVTSTMMVEAVTVSGSSFCFFSVETEIITHLETMIVDAMIVDVAVAVNEIMMVPLAYASGIFM